MVSTSSMKLVKPFSLHSAFSSSQASLYAVRALSSPLSKILPKRCMGSLGAFSMLSANAAAAFSAFFAVLPPEAQADKSRSKLRHKESITVIRFFIKSSAFLKMVIFFYLDYKGKCAAASRRKLTEFIPLFCRFFQFKVYAKNLQKHLLFGISYCILNSCRLEFTRSLREFDLYG